MLPVLLICGPEVVAAEGYLAPDLTLSASTVQGAFLVGEPVVIDLKLTNVGGKGMLFYGELSANTGTIRFEVEGASANVRTYKPLDMRDPSGRANLQPNEALAGIQDVSLLRQQWPGAELMFPAAGRYRVTVHYDGFVPPGVARPAPAVIEIDVREPGTSELENLFRDPRVGRFNAGDVDDADVAQKLAAALGRGRGHPFEPYVYYFLGRNCLSRNETGGSPDPLALTGCVDLLTQAAGRDFQLKDAALLELAQAEMALDRLVPARKHARTSLDVSKRLYIQKKAARLLEKIEHREKGGKK